MVLFLSGLEQNTINLHDGIFYFRSKRRKIKMACITAEVDANLNQCMVNTLLTNLGKKKSY